ncbi:MAG: TonB-dependent receptor [Rubricoccaceae bacterium]
MSTRFSLRAAGLLRLAGLLTLLAAGAAAPAAAQSGKVSGTVTDAQTGERLPGVNVRLEETGQGRATDLNGQYDIIGVRPGEYTLVVTYVGYQAQRIENVRVRIDLTTTVDVRLRSDALDLGGEVVVEAQRPLFQRDVTATTASVSGDEIRALPVDNFNDVVQLQAGVVSSGGDLHFRGGRRGEVGFWVDGVPVTDVYNGALALGIENSSVQELQVVTGAFNAEYGQALSGIVNVVTRDGSNTFEGDFSGFVGDYAARGTTGFSTSGGTGQVLFPGATVSEFRPGTVREGEGSLSGPVLRNRLFFFTSGRYFANDGWVQGYRAFTYDDVGVTPTGRLALLNPAGSGDSSLVSLNPYERLSGQAKLTANFGGGMRLAGNLILSQEDYRDLNFDYFLFPDASRQNQRRARTSILKWTHLLSATTFYEVGVTNNLTRFRNFLFEDPFDARYRDTRFIGFREAPLTSGFAVGGTDNGRFSRQTNTWLAKADVSSQVHPRHLVKTGLEVRQHTLDFLDQFTFIDEDSGLAPQLFTTAQYRYRPFEFAAYIQDKIEAGGLIVNAGIRFDYFDANGIVFRDPTDPATVFPNLRRCAEVRNLQCVAGPDGQPILRENQVTPEELFEPSRPTFQFSPRLGVAFPITAGGVVHFSYGQFFQVPNFELLYQNPWFQLSSAGSGLVGLIGNANLKPEQTINGEIGLKQALSASSAVEVTAYYRDIRNLAGSATDPILIRGTSARYGQLVNSDFGFVRGMILRFDQRVGRNLFAGVDYTFQVARANASDPSQVYNAAAARTQLERQIVPTNWDQRHTANGSISYNDQRRGFGFGLLGSFGSGLRYTPARTSRVTGGTIPPSVIPLNSETLPPNFTVNANVFKDFRIAGASRLQVFSRVDNLFDARNEFGIFGDTGRATYSLQRGIDAATFSGDPRILDRRYTRPDFFAQPRRVVVGMRVGF